MKNYRYSRGCLFAILIIGGLNDLSASGLQPPQPAGREAVNGYVTEVRKYSFTIQSGDVYREVVTNRDTRFRQRLIRPKIDLPGRKIVCEYPGTGGPSNDFRNRTVEIAEANPLYIHAKFDHEKELERNWESGGLRRLVRYDLSTRPFLPEMMLPQPPEILELKGRIETVNSRSVAGIRFGDQVIEAQLLDREAMFIDRSIANLVPQLTFVEIELTEVEGSPVARQVTMTIYPDPLEDEKDQLPRCLVIGDETSFPVVNQLRKDYGEHLNIVHPPENCRGGENVERMNNWLGPWKTDRRRWDIIAYNFGLENLSTPDEEYAGMVRQWTERLKKTGAMLIWVQTVPKEPADWEAQSRQIIRLNRIAWDVLQETPEVLICDPYTGFDETEFRAWRGVEWNKHVADQLAALVLIGPGN